MNNYDYIIIGAGMAGLYMGYLLKKANKNILILDAEDKIGGRAIEGTFYNEPIKLGAGIGSMSNKILLSLLKKLKIKYEIFEGKVNKGNVSPIGLNWNIDSAVEKIICKYKELKKEKNSDINTLTVKEFIKKYFDSKFWKQYFNATDYSDYWDSDLSYYINNYPITDELTNSEDLFYVSWTELANKLSKKLKIKLSTPVTNIKKENNNYLINDIYYCNKLIFATSIYGLNNLYKYIDNKLNWNKYIGFVPFSYIYTYHPKPHNITNMTLVTNEIKKSLAISKNVLMASYADNNLTKYWRKNYKIKTKKQFLDLINLKLKQVFPDITPATDFEFISWTEGVHYFRPIKNNKFNILLNKLSHPQKNIYVIGEILSLRQGWVEGALESAERVFNKMI